MADNGLTPDQERQIRQVMQEDRQKRYQNRALIDNAFPAPGEPKPNYMGSQSMSPNKTDNYTDTNMNTPPMEDRGSYGPGY